MVKMDVEILIWVAEVVSVINEEVVEGINIKELQWLLVDDNAADIIVEFVIFINEVKVIVADKGDLEVKVVVDVSSICEENLIVVDNGKVLIKFFDVFDVENVNVEFNDDVTVEVIDEVTNLGLDQIVVLIIFIEDVVIFIVFK